MHGPHISHVVHPVDSFNQGGICARCEQTGAALFQVCPGVPTGTQIAMRFPKRIEFTPDELAVLEDALINYAENLRERLPGPMTEQQRIRIIDRCQKVSDLYVKLQ